jgi:dienelactone hydrolase
MATKCGRINVVSSSLTIITIFAIWLIGSAAIAAENVSFKGTTKIATGDFLTLTGKLTKPQGDGPFPAVVLMHGCRGIQKAYDDLADKLASWGYVALEVDSLGPRGVKETCTNPFQVAPYVRAQDAYDAKSYLSVLPFVDRNRIGLIGWSHGGVTALAVVSASSYSAVVAAAKANLEPPKGWVPFRAAVAFYPFCGAQLDDTNTPLLILSGELDTWCPPALCQKNMPSGKTTNEVILKIYPGAYHGFDYEGVDMVMLNRHRVLYNPAAFADSIIKVKDFFAKQLK